VIVAAGLIASRFIHYLALSILFGGALFPFYGIAPPEPDQPLVPAWLHALLRASAVVTLLSGITWLAFTTAGMSGSLAGIVDPATLSIVLLDTDFGRIWVLRLLLAAGVVFLLLDRRTSTRRLYAVLFGSLLLLASIALTGHAGSEASSAGFVHRLADAFHLVAAAIWVGALVILARMVVMAVRWKRGDDVRMLHEALSRFSTTGTAVVVVLFLSGIFNPGFLSSLTTAYGQVLLGKLALFVAMLLLAAANRFWLTPWLASTIQSGLNSERPMRLLWASLLAETTLAGLVLLAVGWLGTLAPPARA
jgi:putative copper resistance protein D